MPSKTARTTTEMEKFMPSCAKILFRMIKQGDTISRIKNVFVKSMGVILKYLDYFLLHVLTFKNYYYK